MKAAFDNGGLLHPESDGEQKRSSAFPLVPLTTLWPALFHTQRTVSPTAMVSLAGMNTSEPPGPTMTVCVRGPGIVVVVVAPVPPQLPAPQLSQQLGIVPTHAEPPVGAAHLASLDFTEHFVAPVAVVRQHVTKAVAPHVDFLAQRTTAPRHALGRAPLFTAAFATRATHRTYAA